MNERWCDTEHPDDASAAKRLRSLYRLWSPPDACAWLAPPGAPAEHASPHGPTSSPIPSPDRQEYGVPVKHRRGGQHPADRVRQKS